MNVSFPWQYMPEFHERRQFAPAWTSARGADDLP
jgi:hypothetical protein